MRRLAGGVLLLAAAACAEKGDPPGTVALDWKTTPQTSMLDVTLGNETAPRVVVDRQIILSPQAVSGDIVFALHVEAGTAQVVTPPNPRAVMPNELKAPYVVSATLTSDGHWRKFKGSCNKTAVGLPAIDGQDRFVYDGVLWTDCTIGFHYKSSTKDLNEALFLQVRGDGTIKPTYMGGTAVVR